MDVRPNFTPEYRVLQDSPELRQLRMEYLDKLREARAAEQKRWEQNIAAQLTAQQVPVDVARLAAETSRTVWTAEKNARTIRKIAHRLQSIQFDLMVEEQQSLVD